MVEVRLIDEFPEEMLRRVAGFYESAGWIPPGGDGGFLRSAFQGSALVAGAFDGTRIVGCARALSDGCSDAYIQDVVVDPAYRRRHIGGRLIGTLVDGLRARGVDWIALVGEPGTENFYRKLKWTEKKGFTVWRMENK